MASVQRRPDGTWRARYRDTGDKEHARHFRRRADAERWLDEVRSDLLRGSYVDPAAGRVLFADFARTGSRPLVVALPDDTVNDMFALVSKAGGIATVVTSGGPEFLDLIRVSTSGAPAQQVSEEHCPIHPDTHVDMLVTYLSRQSGPVRCELVAPNFEFDLIREMVASAR